MGRQKSNVREVDAKGRVTLPASFADCTVMLEQPDEYTVVLRKVRFVPMGADSVARGAEDAEKFAESFEEPPPPNDALKKLIRKPRGEKE